MTFERKLRLIRAAAATVLGVALCASPQAWAGPRQVPGERPCAKPQVARSGAPEPLPKEFIPPGPPSDWQPFPTDDSPPATAAQPTGAPPKVPADAQTVKLRVAAGTGVAAPSPAVATLVSAPPRKLPWFWLGLLAVLNVGVMATGAFLILRGRNGMEPPLNTAEHR